MKIENHLHVCLPSRDRLILTKKCIESIYYNSTIFKSTNIYVFDNISQIDKTRRDLFGNMLEEKIIKYYSYDTFESTTNCFPKAIIFQKFIFAMEQKMAIINKIRSHKKYIIRKDYFMLSDNDMIYGPKYDEYFISALNEIEPKYPTIHFLVKYPGGIPTTVKDRMINLTLYNRYNVRESFNVNLACSGGGSGHWIMSYRMLQMLKWSPNDYFNTYKHFKRQDTTTWMMIRNKYNNTFNNNYAKVNYVAGIVPPQNNNPLVIHMGGVLGSMCNALEFNNIRSYSEIKSKLDKKELELKDMTHQEIYNKYKMIPSVRNW